MKKYIVLKEFADKNDLSKQYAPGDVLPETFDEVRIQKILELGLAAEKKAEKEAEDVEKKPAPKPKTN